MPDEIPDAERIRALIAAYRAGEDPDLSQLSRGLWEALYAQIPALTGSRGKDEQHRILETHLVALGLPRCPDLQYIAGPVLWYAREKGVVPPAQVQSSRSEAWTLDPRLYEAALRTLEEGRTAFGDWMTNALQSLLAEQQ